MSLSEPVDGARLIGRPDKNSALQEFAFAPNNGTFIGTTLLLNSTDNPAGNVVAPVGTGMWKLIVRSQDGTVAAEFQWTLDNFGGSGCHFAGTSVPTG